eukprot:COSAG02_NODE_4868_length_4881_cov_7.175659_1_plen_85_part_10
MIGKGAAAVSNAALKGLSTEYDDYELFHTWAGPRTRIRARTSAPRRARAWLAALGGQVRVRKKWLRVHLISRIKVMIIVHTLSQV